MSKMEACNNLLRWQSDLSTLFYQQTASYSNKIQYIDWFGISVLSDLNDPQGHSGGIYD